MRSTSQPLKKQKRAPGQAGKAAAAGVLIAAAEELLASKSVLEPVQLAAPPLDEAADAVAAPTKDVAEGVAEAEAVAVDVPLEAPQNAVPQVSAELAELLEQLEQLSEGQFNASAAAREDLVLDRKSVV